MVPHVPTDAQTQSPLADQLRTQAVCVELLEAARDAHARAVAEALVVTDADERQIARTVRLVMAHGFSFRAASDVLGIDRTKLARILRDREADLADEKARPLGVSA
jgi:hypothetical protein